MAKKNEQWEIPVYWVTDSVDRVAGGYRLNIVVQMKKPQHSQYIKSRAGRLSEWMLGVFARAASFWMREDAPPA